MRFSLDDNLVKRLLKRKHHIKGERLPTSYTDHVTTVPFQLCMPARYSDSHVGIVIDICPRFRNFTASVFVYIYGSHTSRIFIHNFLLGIDSNLQPNMPTELLAPMIGTCRESILLQTLRVLLLP